MLCRPCHHKSHHPRSLCQMDRDRAASLWAQATANPMPVPWSAAWQCQNCLLGQASHGDGTRVRFCSSILVQPGLWSSQEEPALRLRDTERVRREACHPETIPARKCARQYGLVPMLNRDRDGASGVSHQPLKQRCGVVLLSCFRCVLVSAIRLTNPTSRADDSWGGRGCTRFARLAVVRCTWWGLFMPAWRPACPGAGLQLQGPTLTARGCSWCSVIAQGLQGANTGSHTVCWCSTG